MANKIICFDKIRKRFVYAYHIGDDGAAHNKANTTCIGCIGVDLLLPNDILKEINYWMSLFEQCNSRFNKLMDKSQTPSPKGDRDDEWMKENPPFAAPYPKEKRFYIDEVGELLRKYKSGELSISKITELLNEKIK